MLSEDQLYQMWCIYFKDSKMHQEQMKLSLPKLHYFYKFRQKNRALFVTYSICINTLGSMYFPYIWVFLFDGTSYFLVQNFYWDLDTFVASNNDLFKLGEHKY